MDFRDDVARLHHPALPNFPGHYIWNRHFKGATGIFSFVRAGGQSDNFKAKAHAFLNGLKLFGLGYSWGGFQSLARRIDLDESRILRVPYEGPIIRLQIGLEDVVDLRTDHARGFDAARQIS